ncbi:MAG TPA: NAD-dependent epimerase/dehydratase family protein [Xanthomonadaceae bacterium]|nr:NAD-dependent epimerase/dehydratase family protein [Xanthomonadaceae bacterium]
MVTGAAGFIGAHLCQRLLARGERVVGVDDLNDYYPPTLKRARLAALCTGPRFEFVEADIATEGLLTSMLREQAATRVVHLAAQAGVRHSLEAPRRYVRANVQGFLEVLEGARAIGVEHLVYASSSSVYGATAAVPFREDARLDAPMSLYAATKIADEAMAASYAHLFALPTTGLRFFTVYGPWGRPDMAPLKFARALIAGQPIEVYGAGAPLRDFTHIDDIIGGILLALDHPPPASAPHRLFNLGRGQPVSVDAFIAALERATGCTARRIGDMQVTFADIDRARALLGYAPRRNLDQGLADLVAWLRDHEPLAAAA